jgi:hypothetical protein
MAGLRDDLAKVRLLIDIVATARMWVEWRSAFVIADPMASPSVTRHCAADNRTERQSRTGYKGGAATAKHFANRWTTGRNVPAFWAGYWI